MVVIARGCLDELKRPQRDIIGKNMGIDWIGGTHPLWLAEMFSYFYRMGLPSDVWWFINHNIIPQ